MFVLGPLVSKGVRCAAEPRLMEASSANIGKTSNKKPPVWPGACFLAGPWVISR